MTGSECPKHDPAAYWGNRLIDAVVIRLLAKTNPKRPGSKAHATFAKYRDGMTWAQARRKGITCEHVRWDEAHGYIALEWPAPGTMTTQEQRTTRDLLRYALQKQNRARARIRGE